jgi:hypothetical protein
MANQKFFHLKESAESLSKKTLQSILDTGRVSKYDFTKVTEDQAKNIYRTLIENKDSSIESVRVDSYGVVHFHVVNGSSLKSRAVNPSGARIK